jgi:exosome complex RNA-binding protein Rrp4
MKINKSLSGMYANRSNSHVIDRMIDVGEKKHRVSIGQENGRNLAALKKLQRKTHPRENKTSVRFHIDRANEERKVLKLRRNPRLQLRIHDATMDHTGKCASAKENLDHFSSGVHKQVARKVSRCTLLGP